MSDHFCDKVLTIQTHSAQIDELFAQGRDREHRLTEIDTELHGTTRNGGGYLAAHRREHEEAEVELKETMEVLRAGLQTLAGQASELSVKVKELCDRKTGLREMLRASLPALIASAATIVTVIVTRSP